MKNKIITVFARSAFLFALCTPAEAQQPGKIPRIGILISGSPSWCVAAHCRHFSRVSVSLATLKAKTSYLNTGTQTGRPEPVPELAAELVRLKVDVLVTDTSNATEAAKNATKTIPVVFTTANDPVGDGQVASLARPGGNLTGFSLLALDLKGKRLELLEGGVSQGYAGRLSHQTGDKKLRSNASTRRRL